MRLTEAQVLKMVEQFADLTGHDASGASPLRILALPLLVFS